FHLAAVLADRAGRVAQSRFTGAREKKITSFLRQHFGDVAPDAAARARHQRGLPSKIEVHLVQPSFQSATLSRLRAVPPTGRRYHVATAISRTLPSAQNTTGALRCRLSLPPVKRKS